MSREHHFEDVVNGCAPEENRSREGQGSPAECDAKCDSAGVRIRQHGAAQNARTRGHHSGERGFLGNHASCQNWPSPTDSGQHRIRTCDLYGVNVAL